MAASEGHGHWMARGVVAQVREEGRGYGARKSGKDSGLLGV